MRTCLRLARWTVATSRRAFRIGCSMKAKPKEQAAKVKQQRPKGPRNGARKCNYVYTGNEAACREIIDSKTGKPIAPRKKAGDHCEALAMRGKEKCKNHGGKNIGAPIIHGRYSEALHQKAKRAGELFDRAINDPKVLDLTNDIALIDSFIVARIPDLPDVGEDAELWRQAVRIFNQIKRLDIEDPRRELRIKALGEILENGLKHEQAKGEIVELQEHRRKLTETQNRAKSIDAGSLSTRELIIKAVQVINTISRFVEPAICERIALELKYALFSSGPEPEALPESIEHEP